MIGYLTSRAKPEKGGVFIWQEDWDAIVRKLEQLDRENSSLRRMLHDIEDCWDEENRYDYCPYCGADMRGDGDE